MGKLIKQIVNIMGECDGLMLTIKIYSDHEIVFNIYEDQIPLFIDEKNKCVYLDCELYDGKLTVDMIEEIGKIAKLLEDNIDVVLECIN